MFPIPSMCPVTKMAPNLPFAAKDRSRLTREPGLANCKLVRCHVSANKSNFTIRFFPPAAIFTAVITTTVHCKGYPRLAIREHKPLARTRSSMEFARRVICSTVPVFFNDAGEHAWSKTKA